MDETEDTWERIANGHLRLIALVKGSAGDFPSELTDAVKSLSRPLNRSLNSERTRLSGCATDLFTALALSLNESFEPLIPHFIPAILSTATRPNKVYVSRAKACLLAIIEHTQCPTVLPHIRNAIHDKSVSLRVVATELALACLNSFSPPDLESSARAEDLEAIIRSTARDANADVRKSSRKVFEAYKVVLPRRVEAYVQFIPDLDHQNA